jgi:CBS domain-containing protein
MERIPALEEERMEATTTVAQVLRKKGHQVWSVAPDTTMFDALRKMADHDVGALLVMDGNDLAGVISERDYARKVILRGRASKETSVRDLMTRDVITAAPEDAMQKCMERMTEYRIRHLPVMRDGVVIGMISVGDVVEATISEQAFLIEQLQRYIQGGAM